MTNWKWRIAALFGVVVLVAWVWVLNAQIAYHKQRIQHLQKYVDGVGDAMDTLHKSNTHLRLEVLAMQQITSDLWQQSTEQNQNKRKVHEQPDVKPWGDAELPADISRLRQRPAITGAADYYSAVSASNTVQDGTK